MSSYADKLAARALQDEAAGRYADAEAGCRRALETAPHHPVALVTLGNLLRRRAAHEEAVTCYASAVRANPRDVLALNNLGSVLCDLGRVSEAADAISRAIAVAPNVAGSYYNLAAAYNEQGRVIEAVDALRRAVSLAPDSPQIWNALLLTLNRDARPSPADVFGAHAEFARRFATPFASTLRPHDNDRTPGRPLRIGYVSSDFRQHSVTFFLEPILAAHDRSQFHLTAYSFTAPDAVTDRLRARFDTWRDARPLSDADAADLIRRDRIDVLVDLAGHTGTRTLLFAPKPAPVQITYLGYPNTTGLPAMDYRLTDAQADPPGLTDAFNTEKLLRLPQAAWCYQAPKDAPEPAPRDPPSPITFGSFNALSKLSDVTVALWARTVLAVSGGRLLLKAKAFADAGTRELVTARFAAHGLSADRLMLLAQDGDVSSHLARYREVDVALDTFPYHGTTTTCEALLMGVPVVTLAGRTHASRVGVSLLSNIGLPDLVAENPDDFVRIATGLANDPGRLSDLRLTLRDRLLASPVCDAPAFTRNLEAAYRRVWAAWCGAG